MRNRIAYSQNFLKNKELVSSLLEKSSIDNNDTIYEIGAGTGIITQALLEKGCSVIAYEVDTNLYNQLLTKFKNETKLTLLDTNFLSQELANDSYKIFSNIPFNITSSIIKKITQADNPPKDSYLIVQKEAAQKFAGKPFATKNSQVSVLLKPWFEFSIENSFKRDDYHPKPNVDTVLLRINRRADPLINRNNKQLYEDFIVYTFNQFKPNVVEGLEEVFGLKAMIILSQKIEFDRNSKPSELDFNIWLKLFEYLLKNISKEKYKIIEGSNKRILESENHIEKINRTRKDKKWRNYKK